MHAVGAQELSGAKIRSDICLHTLSVPPGDANSFSRAKPELTVLSVALASICECLTNILVYIPNNFFKQILGELYNWTLILFGTSRDPLIDNGHVHDAVVPKQRVKESEKTGTCVIAGFQCHAIENKNQNHSIDKVQILRKERR